VTARNEAAEGSLGRAGGGRREPAGHIAADGFRLRLATEDDVDYLALLAASEEVEPYLAGVSPWGAADVRADLERARTDPEAGARLVLELGDGGGWRPAGGLAYAVQNRRSRIAYLYGVMLDPSARGQGLAERAVRLVAVHLIRDRGLHRVQLEVYAFNERALRLFQRAGFVREGVKRKAYWRHDAWHDGVMFGLVEEDLARNEAAGGGLGRAGGGRREPAGQPRDEAAGGDLGRAGGGRRSRPVTPPGDSSPLG